MTSTRGERPAWCQSMTAAVDGWLKARLEEGEQPASDIYAAGKEAGFSKDQLKRARARMNGIVRRVGFQPKCYWSLPVPSGHADTPVSQAAPATIKHGSASPPPAVAVPAPSKKQLKLSEMVTETGPPSWHPYHSRE